MQQGDMVRFAKWDDVDVRDSKNWPKTAKPYIGMLIEYDKLMGTAHILHDGTIHKIRAVFVEKAGKRDYEKGRQS